MDIYKTIESFIISLILLYRFKQPRKGQYCVNKYAHEGGNTCNLVDKEDSVGKTEDVNMETFPIEAEQLQDTAEEEVDDDDFQDSTIIGENCSLHKNLRIYM